MKKSEMINKIIHSWTTLQTDHKIGDSLHIKLLAELALDTVRKEKLPQDWDKEDV